MRRALELALGPALLAVASYALGSFAICAVAIGLAIIYIGANFAVSAAEHRLRIERRLLHDEIVEGSPAEIEFTLSGVEGLPVKVEVACACGDWHELDAGTSTFRWKIDRPGPHVFERSMLRIKDDLGLFTRQVLAGESQPLLVLPQPADVSHHRRTGGQDLAQDPEPDSVRPYVRGTPMNRIHWKNSARSGELMERTFTTAHDQLPLLVVDTSGAPSSAAVDWAAREAAGQLLALASGGGCRVMLPGDRTPTTLLDPVGGWAGLHRRLADLGEGAPQAPAGTSVRPAVRVRAAAAPADQLRPRGALPPGFRGDGRWAA
ncbi:MAG: DUF58 domain-containing protein [Patulibacter minatonensis]